MSYWELAKLPNFILGIIIKTQVGCNWSNMEFIRQQTMLGESRLVDGQRTQGALAISGRCKKMSAEIDLGYDSSSLLGPLDMQRVRKLEKYFQSSEMPVIFDPSYLQHLSKFHGGTPKKRCFRTAEGDEQVIDRFLNFVDHEADKENGWYNVGVTWSLIEDRLNDYLVPFAALGGGDMLCFNYEQGGNPIIVVWLHEESSEDQPVTDYVAANFDEFLTKLYEPSQ